MGSASINRKLSGKKIHKKSSMPIIGGILVLMMIISGAVVYFMQPPLATISYGICKTFLEINVKYPSTIRMVQVYDIMKETRMTYRFIDEYGQVRSERMTCFFGRNKETGILYITEIKRTEVGKTDYEVTKEEIDVFNKSVFAIMANPPDLTIPEQMPYYVDIKSLKQW